MILLMGGTSEARAILPVLLEEGGVVLLTMATDYSYNLDDEDPQGRVQIMRKRLGKEAMVELLKSSNVHCLVDATHPFAIEASETAMKACREVEIPYIRFQRPESPLPESPLMHRADNVKEAARLACQLGDTIFLTTGTKDLNRLCRETKMQGKKVLARVLPYTESIRKCLEEGIEQNNIIAMKGPFSARLNASLWVDRGADVVITKQTGKAGGLDEKIEAALETGIHLVVINRPNLQYPTCFEDVNRLRLHLREDGII